MYLLVYSHIYIYMNEMYVCFQDEEQVASLSLDDLHRIVLGDQEASDYQVQRARELLDEALQTL